MTKHAIDESLVAKAQALGPLIREHSAEAERERRLSTPVVDALVGSGLTKMFLPKTLGGLATDPITCLRVVEEVASFDSVAGWLLMVANGGAWFCARLPASTAAEIHRDPSNCIIATAFQPPVEAREVSGGYRLTGRRPFASGIHAARWVCLTGMIMEGSAPRMVHGIPEMVVAVMPIEGAEIVDTWHGLGLRGSDSNDVSVNDLFVPKAWTCPLAPSFEPNVHYGAPLYRLPMLGAIVLAHIPPIAMAIAQNAVDVVRAFSDKRRPMASTVALRDRGAAQEKLGRAEAMLRAARAHMYDAMSDAWDRTLAGETLTLAQRADLLLAATHTVQVSAEVTDMMFAAGGSSAVFVGHALERLFRDAQVIRQHGFVCPARYETAAQVSLGLEPDLPVVHF
jgi:alkylation response protein AidB-like acyl-CoA dehydrogenase